MTAINKATISFNERPDLKVDGKKQKFELISLEGQKPFLGVKLGENTYAKLTNRPGGKYDVTMFSTGTKGLADFPVVVKGGAFSRIQGADGKFTQTNPTMLDGGVLKLDKEFADDFKSTGQKVDGPRLKQEDKVEVLTSLRDEIQTRMDHLRESRKLPFGDASKQLAQLKLELADVERRLDRALNKPDTPPSIDISLGTTTTVPKEKDVSQDGPTTKPSLVIGSRPKRDKPPTLETTTKNTETTVENTKEKTEPKVVTQSSSKLTTEDDPPKTVKHSHHKSTVTQEDLENFDLSENPLPKLPSTTGKKEDLPLEKEVGSSPKTEKVVKKDDDSGSKMETID